MRNLQDSNLVRKLIETDSNGNLRTFKWSPWSTLEFWNYVQLVIFLLGVFLRLSYDFLHLTHIYQSSLHWSYDKGFIMWSNSKVLRVLFFTIDVGTLMWNDEFDTYIFSVDKDNMMSNDHCLTFIENYICEIQLCCWLFDLLNIFCAWSRYYVCNAKFYNFMISSSCGLMNEN